MAEDPEDNETLETFSNSMDHDFHPKDPVCVQGLVPSLVPRGGGGPCRVGARGGLQVTAERP